MTTWLTQWGSVFVTLVVILDPPGAVPIFLADYVLATYGTAIAALALFAFFAIAADNFVNPTNLLNVGKQVSFLAILAIGFGIATLVYAGWAVYHLVSTPRVSFAESYADDDED